MKVLAITLNELLIVLRDRTALWRLLAAPLALTAILSLAFCQVNASGSVRALVSGWQASGRFDYLAYYAPSMATLFLMFAMMSSARTLLAEREAGILDRLRAAPLLAGELLGGKILGAVFIGLLQMMALIVITRFLMGVAWGDPLTVAAHTALVVAATAALGLVIAALARTASQANAIGSAVTLVLAAAGGNFVPRLAFPAWLKTVSCVSPNAWGMEGFQKLALGARLGDLAPELAALALMTAVLLSLGFWGLQRIVK